MSQINVGSLPFYLVQGLMVPEEGPRAVPLLLDFSAAGEYDINLQNVQSRNFISLVQALYLDNSAGGTPLTVNLPNTGQNIIIAPNRQGYRMVLCPNPAMLRFISASGVIVPVFILNFPVTNADWPCNTGA